MFQSPYRELLLGASRVSLAAVLLNLFAAGEPGWVYDPSQLDTMFQDSAGTTPVTGPGDPVGLNLDKRLWGGKTLAQVIAGQPEKLTNPDFTSNLTGWAADDQGAGAASAWDSGAGGRMALPRIDGSNYGRRYQAFTTVVGAGYQIVGAQTAGAGRLNLRVGTTIAGTQNLNQTITPNSVATASYFFVATATTTYITLVPVDNAATTYVESASLKEIPGFHRQQTTSAARPTLARVPYGGRRNILTRTEEFDSAAWTKAQVSSVLPAVTANAGLDPDGNMLADRIDFGAVDATTDVSVIYQEFTFAAADAGDWTGGLYLKAFAAGDVGKVIYVYLLDGAATLESLQTVVLTNSYQLVNATSNLGAGTVRRLSFGTGGSGAFPGAANQAAVSVLAAQAQFEKGTTRSAYQKVTSTHDVTETGKADCWYFSYDGTDDHFVSLGNFDPASDKMLLGTSIYKMANAFAPIVEQSVNFNSPNGAFILYTDTINVYPVGHHTAAGYAVYSSTAYATEHQATIIAGLDIAGTSRATEIPLFEVNGVDARIANVGSYADGTGNYVNNQPIYWGRRGGASNPFQGREFASIGRGGSLPSASQIAALRTYMAGKAGVTL